MDLNLVKAKTIQAIEPATTCKQLEASGELSHVRIFIPALAELLEPLDKLVKKNMSS